MMGKLLYTLSFAALFCGTLTCYAQQPGSGGDQDPPTRAARLSYFNGSVSMEPAGIDDWSPVEVNRPFTTGDYLYTDQKAVAELQLDSAVFRMGQVTSFGFLNLNDQMAQLKLTEGDLHFRVHDLGPSQVYEIDTPNAAITLLRGGVYRIHVDPDANTTFVSVREGQAEITGGGQAFTLNPAQSANLSGTDQLAYDIEQAPAPDTLDQWSAQRDQQEMQASATRYVPPSMVGYSDLNQYGNWTQAPDYGPVWYPSQAPSDWAPYHSGHWVWIDPWGWSWVDTQPWAFAPSHYGRWVYFHERWGWTPGPVVAVGVERPRPFYAPALVAWFGGAHWGVSVSIGGGGPSVGWVPLGYGEVYTPSYHVSPTYFRNVNINNTRVVNTVNITNVYNTVYVQKTVYNQTFANSRAPRGVISVPSSALAGGRPIQQFSHPVASADFERMRGAQMVAPGVVPTRNSVAPLMGRPAPHPNQAFFARPIVARSTPAPVVPFAQRQAFVQQHAGEPVNFSAMRQQYRAQAPPIPIARVQQPTHPPEQVHPGQHFGNMPPQAAAHQQPGSQPGAPRQEPAAHQPQASGQPLAEHQAQTPGQRPPPDHPAHGLPPNRLGNPAAAQQNVPNPQHEEQARPQPESRPAHEPTPPNRVGNPAAAHQNVPNPPHEEQARPQPESRPAHEPTRQPEARPESRTEQPARPEPQHTAPAQPRPEAAHPVAPPHPEQHAAAPPHPEQHGTPPAHAEEHHSESHDKDKEHKPDDTKK